MKDSVGVLFVCTGNICRSPTAEGVFRSMVEDRGLATQILVDSAGTHDYHVGEPPDPRTIRAAASRGYDLSPLRARQAKRNDFLDFTYVLAMDRGHLGILQRMQRGVGGTTPRLALEFSRKFPQADVPDPYYGGPDGFEHVLDMIEDASEHLLEHILAEHAGLNPGR